jgi:hypothetical protein
VLDEEGAALEVVALDDVVALDEAVALGDAVDASVVAPIGPSNTITPHARVKVASVAATTVRRIRATRRARAARRARPSATRSDGWGVGMTSS